MMADTNLRGYWTKFFHDAEIYEPECSMYVQKFMENLIKPNCLCELNENHLDKIGISSLGDRLSIIRLAKSRISDEAVVAGISTSTGTGNSPPSKKIRLEESKPVDNPETSQDVGASTSFLGSSTTIPQTEALHNQFYITMSKTFPTNSKEAAGAYWAASFILPYFSTLERQYVENLDKVSLLVIRNRIDYLELLFMVDDRSVSELLPALNLSDTEVERVTIEVMKKVKANSSPSFQELNSLISQEILKKTQVMHVAATQATEAPMSALISKKASVHYFRWKYVFKYSLISQEILKKTQVMHVAATQATEAPMSALISKKASVHYFRWKYVFKFGSHSGITKIKAFLDKRNIPEEDFFIEIAHLFIITSTIGVHLLVMPNVGIESIKRSLKIYSMNQPTTVSVVESLFCTIPSS